MGGYYFKKFVTTATRVSPPTSATKSALSGHSDCRNECPLLGVKRASKFESVASAFDADIVALIDTP